MDSVSNFIRTAFRSVWALELLLHLKASEPRPWSRDELVDAMRGSRLLVDQSLDGLLRMGLISIDGDGLVRFQPATEELASLTELAQREYVTRPDAVRRLIVSGAHRGLANFADAFRLWKD